MTQKTNRPAGFPGAHHEHKKNIVQRSISQNWTPGGGKIRAARPTTVPLRKFFADFHKKVSKN
jgi:hypothetical protein